MGLQRGTVIALTLALLIAAGPQEPAAGGADLYGDPLPPRAVARLGTVRLRHAGADNTHGASVTCLAYAPDGKSVVSGGGEGTIRVWEIQTGKEILRIKAHEGPISSLAFSPDGSRLVSGGGDTMVFSRMWSDGDKTVRVWDVATGQVAITFFGHRRGVTAVAFSPDGTRVASGSLDETVRVWDLASGREAASLEGYAGGVSALYFTRDGQSLLTCDGEHRMRTHEIAGGRQGFQVDLKGRIGKWPNRDVTNLSLSPDGRTIVTVDGEFVSKVVKLWDAATGKEKPVQWTAGGETGTRFVYAGLISPDGKLLATRGGAGSLLLWPMAGGARLHDLVGHEIDVSAFAFSPDGKILASGSDDRTIRFWDTATGKELPKAAAHDSSVEDVAFSPDGKTIATIGGDTRVRVWDPATGRALRKIDLPGRQNWGTHVVYFPEGKELAASGRDGTVHVLDPASGRYLYGRSAIPPEIHGWGQVDAFAISPDGKALAVACFDTVRLLDLSSGKEILRPKDPTSRVSWMRFTPDSQHLLMLGKADPSAKGEALILCQRQSGTRILASPLAGEEWHRVALSPDGRTLAIAESKGPVSLWEVATGKEVLKLPGHPKMAGALAFSPSGALLATGGYDRAIRIWDVADGQERATLEGHVEHVASVAFSPDGKSLASVSSDTTGLVWDVSSIAPGTSTAGDLDREACFADLLLRTEAAKAYRAMTALSRAGDSVVPLLKDRLLRPGVDATRMRALVEALDHPEITERGKAAEELERTGNEMLLRRALLDASSSEARARLEGILKGYEGPCPRSGEALRAIRILQILERIGSPAACAALDDIVKEQPESRPARDAAAALRRIRR